MAETVLLWNDKGACAQVIQGITADDGGDDGSLPPYSYFWAPSQKPLVATSEDEEFESVDLDPRWNKIGNWQSGGVERGASFTTPSGLVKYSINSDRPSHLVMQAVAEDSSTGGGLWRKLLTQNLNGGNAPTNWLLDINVFSENDKSSIPVSNNDNLLLVMMADEAVGGGPDFNKWVGFFVITDYENLDNPVKAGMVHVTPPDDLEPISDTSFVALSALPSFNELKIHKVGTMYRGYVVIDGRDVEVGTINLPTHNPKIYALIGGNTDTPNCLVFSDYVRHKFAARDAS